MSEISFKKGEFQEFRATVTFYIGDLEFSINKGDHVWFDGYVADFGDGEYEKCSKLKAAIRSNWLEPVEAAVTENKPYRPRMNSVKLSPSAPGKDKRAAQIETEENIVGNVEAASVVHENNMKSWNNNFLVDEESGQLHAEAADSVEDLRTAPCGRIWILEPPLMDVSATGIRERIADGRSPRYLMPEPVWQRICQLGLYTP